MNHRPNKKDFRSGHYRVSLLHEGGWVTTESEVGFYPDVATVLGKIRAVLELLKVSKILQLTSARYPIFHIFRCHKVPTVFYNFHSLALAETVC